MGRKGKEVEGDVRAKWGNGEGGLWKVLGGEIRTDQGKGEGGMATYEYKSNDTQTKEGE